MVLFKINYFGRKKSVESKIARAQMQVGTITEVKNSDFSQD